MRRHLILVYLNFHNLQRNIFGSYVGFMFLCKTKLSNHVIVHMNDKLNFVTIRLEDIIMRSLRALIIMLSNFPLKNFVCISPFGYSRQFLVLLSHSPSSSKASQIKRLPQHNDTCFEYIAFTNGTLEVTCLSKTVPRQAFFINR